jgi:hypothetical protein
MRHLLGAGIILCLTGFVLPAAAGEAGQAGDCAWCARDAIYADVSLINHLEANADLDDGIKGPEITAARADIHRLRKLIGPLVEDNPYPCCYSRKPLYVR